MTNIPPTNSSAERLDAAWDEILSDAEEERTATDSASKPFADRAVILILSFLAAIGVAGGILLFGLSKL